MQDFEAAEPGSMLVNVWPDGSYCFREDFKEHEWNHMSDDYEIIDLYDFERVNNHPDQALMQEIIEEYIGDVT